jgi:hypothetical protein
MAEEQVPALLPKINGGTLPKVDTFSRKHEIQQDIRKYGAQT